MNVMIPECAQIVAHRKIISTLHRNSANLCPNPGAVGRKTGWTGWDASGTVPRHHRKPAVPKTPKTQKTRAAPPARRPAPATDRGGLELEGLPGHLVRRLHQVAVALFAEEIDRVGADLTPVQYAALATVEAHAGIDQASLAGVIGYDRTTIGGVVERLEAKGLIHRITSPSDRRVRQLSITAEGVALLRSLVAPVRQVQDRLMAPLAAAEQATLVRLMTKLVHATNELSRTPTRPAPPLSAATTDPATPRRR
jgi:DNA-binding MarR family transcriptional regulator